MSRTKKPPTSGRWHPIVRGRGTSSERIVGWVEVFRAPHGQWVTVPDASRIIRVGGTMTPTGGCETREDFEVSAVEAALWATRQTMRSLEAHGASGWLDLYLPMLEGEIMSMQSSRAWAWWDQGSEVMR